MSRCYCLLLNNQIILNLNLSDNLTKNNSFFYPRRLRFIAVTLTVYIFFLKLKEFFKFRLTWPYSYLNCLGNTSLFCPFLVRSFPRPVFEAKSEPITHQATYNAKFCNVVGNSPKGSAKSFADRFLPFWKYGTVNKYNSKVIKRDNWTIFKNSFINLIRDHVQTPTTRI